MNSSPAGRPCRDSQRWVSRRQRSGRPVTYTTVSPRATSSRPRPRPRAAAGRRRGGEEAVPVLGPAVQERQPVPDVGHDAVDVDDRVRPDALRSPVRGSAPPAPRGPPYGGTVAGMTDGRRRWRDGHHRAAAVGHTVRTNPGAGGARGRRPTTRCCGCRPRDDIANHVGGPHAGAIFTLGEAAAAVLMLHGSATGWTGPCRWRSAHAIEWSKLARSAVTATRRPTASCDRVQAELAAGERPEWETLVVFRRASRTARSARG